MYDVAEIKITGTTSKADQVYDPNYWREFALQFARQASLDAQKNIKSIMADGMFNKGHSSGRGLKAIKQMDIENGGMVYVDMDKKTGAPYLFYQEKGVHEHKMTYLIDAVSKGTYGKNKGDRSAIPIKLPDGTTIFRWPNKDRIMAGDQFYHTGYDGKFFYRSGIERTMEEMKAKYKEISFRMIMR